MRLNFETATFRINPAHELILFERLSESERRELGQLTSDPDYCAIVRSRAGPAWRVKLVCRNTVDLCSHFTTPNSLSSGLSAKFGDSLRQTVAQLVMDGVLEVEHAGGFVSGPPAYALFREERRRVAPESRISKLSIEALRHAETLAIADSMRLCARLYFFNRLPLSPEQRIRFPDARAVLGFLGVSGEGKVQKVLAASWQASAAANAGWLVWRHRNGLTSRTEVTYKLYISPMPERLGEVFSATVAVLTEMRVPAFKVGRDLPGILRPDKLIAYFSDLDLLHATARRLTESIGGVPGHGVPFSAEISSDGLLSWGADPPPVSGQGQVEEQESWRFWITSRLAAALISARGTPVTGTQPWQFAMERVRLEGVDTDTWTPVSGVWKPSTRVSEVSRHGHY